MPVITTIEDLRSLARRRVPRMFYDYADSGSWTEGTRLNLLRRETAWMRRGPPALRRPQRTSRRRSCSADRASPKS